MEPDQWHHELRITWSLGCLGYVWFPDDVFVVFIWHLRWPSRLSRIQRLQDLYIDIIYLCLSLKHCVVSHPPLSWLTDSCFKFHQLLGSLDTSCFTTPKPRNWREFLEKGLRSRLRRTADQWHGGSLRIFCHVGLLEVTGFLPWIATLSRFFFVTKHPWCFWIRSSYLWDFLSELCIRNRKPSSSPGRTCRLPTHLHGGQITGLQFKRFCTLSGRHPGTGTHRRGVSRGCHWESWYSFWGQDTVGNFSTFPKWRGTKIGQPIQRMIPEPNLHPLNILNQTPQWKFCKNQTAMLVGPSVATT